MKRNLPALTAFTRSTGLRFAAAVLASAGLLLAGACGKLDVADPELELDPDPVEAAVPASSGTNVWLVLPLEPTGESPPSRELCGAVVDLVTLALQPALVVERERLDELLEEQALSSANNRELALGKLLKATLIIAGSVESRDGKVSVRIRCLDVASGEIRGTTSADATMDNLDLLATRLVDGLAVDERSGIQQDEAVDLDTAEFRSQFGQALGAHLAGDTTRAIPRFLGCLEERPQHLQSRLWLARAYLAADSPLEGWVALDPVKTEAANVLRRECTAAFGAEEARIFHEWLYDN